MAASSLPLLSSSSSWQLSWITYPTSTFLCFQNFKLHYYMLELRPRAKKYTIQSLASNDGVPSSKKGPRKSRKKLTIDTTLEDNTTPLATSKKTRTSRKKVAPSPTTSVDSKKKVARRKKTEKAVDDSTDRGSDSEYRNVEWPAVMETNEDERDQDLDFTQGEEEDISFTYSWPPLVCCFGSAQHAFVPSGRPAHRLIDYEIHERMKDALWSPEKFVRAPGSSSGSVSIALASLGGRVAFMGKLGDDDYGQTMLYYLNVNNVQTRSTTVDSNKLTAVSHMRIVRSGGLRMTCVKPCAEDSFLKSEINIDVLKEAKMFYFNSSSLLERDMRSTTLQAIKISKKLGGVIFFDLNLPMPLWQSADETKTCIREAWNLADIIELTKQELEFLCGIEPSDKFVTKDNDKSKFIHYQHEVIMPLWHENLKVLFVTNGTSKIHYYTEKHNGSVRGMEDAPITPFTCDMSASGDGIVAALMRMLAVQPHLITDKMYLERTINYAIDCGVIDQWMLGRTRGFPPNEDAEEQLVSDPNGIRSITEKQHRTLDPVS
ncbi:hypothetical protein IFM89_015457 [Coptis chinensis]|uniref:Carbohydrate kinase PfkB domain-containing protein n=1 Tax=Coptis chinensis TaxID=261450 RepID=A0A835LZK7_9MAGN|nr:hypothetical protein IFM89_015457 [Coptis chinensis]